MVINRVVRSAVVCSLLALAGCSAVPSGTERGEAARQLAVSAGLQPFTPVTALLPLRGYARLQEDHAALAVYIEGDGHAWINRYTPSDDPTPVNPVALKLAALDDSANVVYLGRPGQYLHTTPAGKVDARYWLSARFAPEVVDTYTLVIRQLVSSIAATSVDIIGYSGGGAIAALVAARLRREAPALPLTLRTVAGNLDTAAWVHLLRITPLDSSLNPVDEAAVLRTVPQLHLTGLHDRQVPPAVFSSYADALGSRRCLREIRVDASHAGPWEEAWRAALKVTPLCAPAP